MYCLRFRLFKVSRFFRSSISGNSQANLHRLLKVWGWAVKKNSTKLLFSSIGFGCSFVEGLNSKSESTKYGSATSLLWNTKECFHFIKPFLNLELCLSYPKSLSDRGQQSCNPFEQRHCQVSDADAMNHRPRKLAVWK